MFKLSQNDINKLTKGLNYLMDNDSPLFLIKGNRQTLLRLEMSETDEDGDLQVVFSGAEFTLDNEIPEDILIHDGVSFLSNLKLCKDPFLSIVECEDDGSVELEVTDNRFTFTTKLKDNNYIFKEYGKDIQLIEKHKKILNTGLITRLSESGFDKIDINLFQEDYEIIKKMKSIETLKVSLNEDKLSILGVEKVVKNTMKLTINTQNENNAEFSFTIPINRLTKIGKCDYIMSVYYKEDNVGACLLTSLDNSISFIIPLYETN